MLKERDANVSLLWEDKCNIMRCVCVNGSVQNWSVSLFQGNILREKKRAKLSHMMKSRIDFLSVCVKMMDLVQIILGGGIRV